MILPLESLGWITTPSPVEAHPLAPLETLLVKRDDLLRGPLGGNKIRKLDFLLAQEPFKSAKSWSSLGAIGSGHLVATGVAARTLGKPFFAHCFYEPPEPYVLKNLANIASSATTLEYYRSRLTVALTHPRILTQRHGPDTAIIAPGGSVPAGVIGFVRAGLELAEQLQNPIDKIYLALGSGGTTAGLAIGLALAERPIPIVAISAIERTLAPPKRLHKLVAETRRYLQAHGVETPEPAPIQLDYSQVAPGYGRASQASIAACAALPHLPLEPIYTGKAMAALMRDAQAGTVKRALFWLTPHGQSPTPEQDWHERLPKRLRTLVEPLLTR